MVLLYAGWILAGIYLALEVFLFGKSYVKAWLNDEEVGKRQVLAAMLPDKDIPGAIKIFTVFFCLVWTPMAGYLLLSNIGLVLLGGALYGLARLARAINRIKRKIK